MKKQYIRLKRKQNKIPKNIDAVHTGKVQLELLHIEFLKEAQHPFLDERYHCHSHHKEVH